MYMPVGATHQNDSHDDPDSGSTAYADAVNTKQRYKDAATLARRAYQISEVCIVVVAAGVPICGVLWPTDARWAAILGAIVAALTGLRAVFHWRENWTRFSVAYTQVLGELQRYSAHAAPYDSDSDASRDAALAVNVSKIENAETVQWSALRGPEGSGKGATLKGGEKPDDDGKSGDDKA